MGKMGSTTGITITGLAIALTVLLLVRYGFMKNPGLIVNLIGIQCRSPDRSFAQTHNMCDFEYNISIENTSSKYIAFDRYILKGTFGPDLETYNGILVKGLDAHEKTNFTAHCPNDLSHFKLFIRIYNGSYKEKDAVTSTIPLSLYTLPTAKK
jgi:hypothetical protein